jgi:hypothetical protein
VLNLQVAADAISDELRFVIAFERITKYKVLGHDAVQSWAIAISHGLYPLFIHVAQVPFDFERIRMHAHLTFASTTDRRTSQPALIGRILFAIGVG